MSHQSSTPQSTRRGPILWVLGSLAVLTLCGLFACIASAGLLLINVRTTGAAPAPAVGVSSPEPESLTAGNPEAGEQLFSGEWGCSACHSLEPDVRVVGPSLAGIADRAKASSSSSAEAYIYESIVNPKASVAAGYPSNLMPENYGRLFSDQQLADLVAFMMTR